MPKLVEYKPNLQTDESFQRHCDEGALLASENAAKQDKTKGEKIVNAIQIIAFKALFFFLV